MTQQRDMATASFLDNVERDYPDYLRDESRMTGRADSISFPKTEEDVCQHLLRAAEAGLCVTTQGARTGITGGAVPRGGHILNLSRMNRITRLRRDPASDSLVVSVQPGVLLTDLRAVWESRSLDPAATDDPAAAEDALRAWRERGDLFLPPDPTEASASLGGMVACNASGARSYRYGPTRRYVRAARVALADGSVLRLERGKPRLQGRAFSAIADSGRLICGLAPGYRMPQVKNAAGYYAADDMDLLDLFIGSEGTLGVFSEVDLALEPAPAAMWGLAAFFPAEPNALQFVQTVRARDRQAGGGPPANVAAIEFFDARALELLRRQKASNPAFAEIPEIPAPWHSCVYVELHAANADEAEAALLAVSEPMAACGGSDEASWLASDPRELARLKYFRHAVPEAVNLTVGERRKKEPGITKLGTDLAVPDEALERTLAMYRAGLESSGLESVMFGHIGNNHLHVNILAATLEDYERGKALYRDWAKEVVRAGGSVSAEHGVGKLKTALLRDMYGEEGIREMQEVKRLFDPEGRLNPGNLFEGGENR